MKKVFLAMIVGMLGCGNVIIDWSGTGGEVGGSGGSTQTSTETASSSGGTGGVGSSSTSLETTSSTTDTLSTITSTTTKTCDNPKTTICFEACCDEPVNPTMCIGNEAGYCCPDFMYCIPKS